MDLSIEAILVWTGLLLLTSILASKISAYLGVPALLLFLLIGMLAGSEGVGGIYFDDAELSQLLGVVALSYILFSGGLDTRPDRIRPVLGQGLVLSTLGVFITALSVGGFAIVVLNFSTEQGILLGAIVSSTDAAAVFAVLRGKNVGLKGQLTPLLELESGSNDPMAIFLTLGMIRLIESPNTSPLALIPLFLQQMGLGAVLGYGAGRLIVIAINRLRLEYEGLYPVLTLALVLVVYGVTTLIGGNGFLAVYLAGVVTGSGKFIHKTSLGRFHEGLAWLMQIVMFLTLGLLVFPSELVHIAGNGLLIALFLILVARPLSVFLSLGLTRMTNAEKTLIAWVGLRGAAPIILATFPLLAGVPNANTMFNLVFFIVLTSVLIQGTTLTLVARKLGVHEPAAALLPQPIEFNPPVSLRSDLVELMIPAESPLVGQQVVQAGLPEGTLIVLLGRGNDFLVPNGSTVFEAGDRLLILASKDCLTRVRDLVKNAPDQMPSG